MSFTITITSTATREELQIARDLIDRIMAMESRATPGTSTRENPQLLAYATAEPISLPVAPVPPAPILVDMPTAAPVVPVPKPPITDEEAVAAGAASPPAGHLDADGLPYDARIHSAGRSLKADGCWRSKRNVPDELKAQIEAELRQVVAAAPQASALDPQIAFAPQVLAQAPAVPTPPPVAALVIPAPPAPQATVSMTGSVGVPKTYIDFVPRIAVLLGERRLSNERLNELLKAHGIPSLGALAAASGQDATLIERLWAIIVTEAGA